MDYKLPAGFAQPLQASVGTQTTMGHENLLVPEIKFHCLNVPHTFRWKSASWDQSWQTNMWPQHKKCQTQHPLHILWSSVNVQSQDSQLILARAKRLINHTVTSHRTDVRAQVRDFEEGLAGQKLCCPQPVNFAERWPEAWSLLNHVDYQQKVQMHHLKRDNFAWSEKTLGDAGRKM